MGRTVALMVIAINTTLVQLRPSSCCSCPIHRTPHGARSLTVLDDETRCWLNNITATSDPGSTAAWGSKKDKTSASVLFVSNLEWMPFQTTMTTTITLLCFKKRHFTALSLFEEFQQAAQISRIIT